MADGGIKKYSVPITDLPPLDTNTQGYNVRYRIISEDRNRISHWSPVYILKPDYTFITGQILFNKAGSIASIAWDEVEITKIDNANTYSIGKAIEYDIWLRWDRGEENGDWIYKERIEGTSVSIPVPDTWTVDGITQETSPNRLSVEIYLKGFPVERGDGNVGTPFLKVYKLTNQTV